MLVIGLTGGIGTGKTTAAEHLESRGFARIDADEIGRELTADGQPMLEILDDVFGPEGEMGTGAIIVRRDSGVAVLDRRTLANIVFKDENKRERFDKIVHTEMKKIIDSRIASLQSSGSEEGYSGILLDAPLLFEAEINDRCHVVILITADTDVRIGRVCDRDNTTPDEVEDRILNQMSDDEKRRYSDFVVENNGEIEELFSALDEIVDYLLDKNNY
ncbi:MAG: dephospho-CoA kinase [Lentihominibacter sp.]|jgi:dephospho-CoA kinase